MLEQIAHIGRINPTLPQAVTETGMEAKAALSQVIEVIRETGSEWA